MNNNTCQHDKYLQEINELNKQLYNAKLLIEKLTIENKEIIKRENEQNILLEQSQSRLQDALILNQRLLNTASLQNILSKPPPPPQLLIKHFQQISSNLNPPMHMQYYQ